MDLNLHILKVVDRDGEDKGSYECEVEGAYFVIYLKYPDSNESIKADRGDSVYIDNETSPRSVIGVSIASSTIHECVRILAPRVVKKPNPNADYMRDNGTALRPGTKIFGGRGSGFYDEYALIIDAVHVGGDEDAFQDWAYYVVAAQDYWDRKTGHWIILDDVGGVVNSPSASLCFETKKSEIVDSLILQCDQELIEYCTQNAEVIDSLSGRQFESLMVSVYKNLGFEVEPVGRWNQADGGVDIIAVSYTDAGTPIKLAIQCKTSKNRIQAKPIRELAGVLDTFQAHQGIVATTSKFTGPARQETEGHIWRMALQDRDDILRKMMSIVDPELKQFIDRLEKQRKD
jgi:hypothetical protein